MRNHEDLLMMAGLSLLSKLYKAEGIENQIHAQERFIGYVDLLTGLEEQDKLYTLLCGYYEYKVMVK